MPPTSPDPLLLGAEFPAPSHEAWMALVSRLLKGGDFDKRLVKRTYDGIAIPPLTTRADRPTGDVSGFPGQAPFTRHAHAAGSARTGWDICQRHTHPDPRLANRAILEDLEGGATSVNLVVNTDGIPDSLNSSLLHGVSVPTLQALSTVLDGVLLDLAPVMLDARDEGFVAATMMLALWDEKGYAPDAVAGSLNIDPLGALAMCGHVSAPVEAILGRAGSFAAYINQTRPNVRSLRADTRPYHNAGASEAQELAAALATGVAYLRAMESAGLSIDDACRQIQFTFAVDADQFLTIAKLRAARLLWDRVTAACGASEETRAMALHAQTSGRMMTRRDPWVNLLRTTMATFAAACGGAETITTLPFTAALGHPDRFALRLARNIQIILMEETGLGRVIDPAGGAWSIEKLTEDLAEQGWALFQEIEREGGMAETLESGAFSLRIGKMHETRMRNVATRRDPITGISEFPDLFETPVTMDKPDMGAIAAQTKVEIEAHAQRADVQTALTSIKQMKSRSPDGVKTLISAVRAGAPVTELNRALATAPVDQGHLPVCRISEPFETLRDAADHHKTMHGTLPRVVLVTLGPIADHTARMAFARNLLATGGIEGVDTGAVDTADRAAAAFKSMTLPIAVLCGSTDHYTSMGAQTVAALKQAGAQCILVAGRPNELTGTDTDGFLFAGCDAIEALQDLHTRLGVIGGDRQ